MGEVGLLNDWNAVLATWSINRLIETSELCVVIRKMIKWSCVIILCQVGWGKANAAGVCDSRSFLVSLASLALRTIADRSSRAEGAPPGKVRGFFSRGGRRQRREGVRAGAHCSEKVKCNCRWQMISLLHSGGRSTCVTITRLPFCLAVGRVNARIA